MKKSKKIKKNLGFTLIEVLIACSIISVSMFALMQTAQKGIILSDQSLRESQANFLLEEGVEAIKSIRDNGWTNISTLDLSPTKYHIFFNNSTKEWVLDTSSTSLLESTTSYPIDSIFDRTVIVSSVGRDPNDDILSSGGTIDPQTVKVTINVSWESSHGIISKSLDFYLADIFN